MWVPIYMLINSVGTTNRYDQLHEVWRDAICTGGCENYTAGICTFKFPLCVEVCVHFTQLKRPCSVCVVTLILVWSLLLPLSLLLMQLICVLCLPWLPHFYIGSSVAPTSEVRFVSDVFTRQYWFSVAADGIRCIRNFVLIRPAFLALKCANSRMRLGHKNMTAVGGTALDL